VKRKGGGGVLIKEKKKITTKGKQTKVTRRGEKKTPKIVQTTRSRPRRKTPLEKGFGGFGGVGVG